ncbi:MAG: shikimate dehydrogenase family protein [Eggerthellaceae bacterium]
MSKKTEISGHTHLISLIAKPIRHSLSPATHNLSFEKLGVDSVYLVFDVDQKPLPIIIAAMKELDGWDGSNVSMPNKQAIIPLLDSLSDAAELMGAVNVLKKEENGAITGHNTDGVGMMQNLRNHGVDPAGKVFTVVGPGGAGSAILVQAALDGAKKIHVFAREGGPSYNHSLDLLPRVHEKTGCELILHCFENKEEMKEAIAESDILVNATPVGMGDVSEESSVPAELIKDGMVVADAVYHPRMTKILRDAEAKGCKIVGGIGMMLEQAAAGEEIWYGVKMPTEEIAKELFPEE